MPFKYGTYITKKRVQKDRAFLTDAGLSDEQATVVQNHFYKGMGIREFLTFVFMIIVIGGLLYLWTPLLWEFFESVQDIKSISKEEQ